MNRRLLWKLCIIIATGTVALFYVINVLTSRAEEGMSFLDSEYQSQLTEWGEQAERLYLSGDRESLRRWLQALQEQEETWAAVIESELRGVAGSHLNERFYEGFSLGRDIHWKIHLYFSDNPMMEVTFANRHTHFLILLPDRMRPGLYWGYTSVALQIILPMVLLILLSIVLYRHIMSPLRQLELATRAFSQGKFDVRVRAQLGRRSDELTELANTFDQMAARIGELIINQRQLISDLSHELRTPLTRLDIGIENLSNGNDNAVDIERINQESRQIRRLVDDTLTLAWLENERPQLQHETLDLADLIDVLVEDARFEFPDRKLHTQLPEHAEVYNSNHRAVGQALENIIRNALRYTPSGKVVTVSIEPFIVDRQENGFCISICDQGPGIPEPQLDKIFQPFFRVESSRLVSSGGFGLGLALARRQLQAVGGSVSASNLEVGLKMTVTLPRHNNPLKSQQSPEIVTNVKMLSFFD